MDGAARLVRRDGLAPLGPRDLHKHSLEIQFPEFKKGVPLHIQHRRCRSAGALGGALRIRSETLPEALHEIGRMMVNDSEAVLAGREPTRMQCATPELIDRLGG